MSIPPYTDQSTVAQAKKLITPLGAAIVEALPDREKVKRIKRRFKQGICPSSEIFAPNDVVAFYKDQGLTVVVDSPKSSKQKHWRKSPAD